MKITKTHLSQLIKEEVQRLQSKEAIESKIAVLKEEMESIGYPYRDSLLQENIADNALMNFRNVPLFGRYIIDFRLSPGPRSLTLWLATEKAEENGKKLSEFDTITIKYYAVENGGWELVGFGMTGGNQTADDKKVLQQLADIADKAF